MTWKEIIEAAYGEDGVVHPPLCPNPGCRKPMDWLQVFREGELIHESPVCVECSSVEIRALSQRKEVKK